MNATRYTPKQLDSEAYAAARTDAVRLKLKLWIKRPIWRLEINGAAPRLLVLWWDMQKQPHETTVAI